MPPSWLLSPTALFSRTSSTSSVPTLLSPSLEIKSPFHSDALLTPFEQEYGKPDLPGGWLDEAVLRQKLVDAVKDGHTKLSSEVSEESDDVEGSWERDIRVTKLMIHPIKSCRGIALQTSVLTPQGLEFDRQWAIRNSSSGQLVTAREQPKLVLISCHIDQAANELRVAFPKDAELDGFSVALRAGLEEMSSWEKITSSIMHGHTLPPALLVPALHSPSTSPSAQISRFLGIDVQLVRVSPIKEDVRRCDAPPGEGEKTEWEEESLRLGASGEVTTGFADGYPLLIANEESYRAVATSIADSAADAYPTGLTDLGPTFDKARWQTRLFDYRRFRANIIVGSNCDLPLELQDVSLDEAHAEQPLTGPTRPASAWEEDSWRELEFTSNDGSGTRKGSLICTSRCGRCQLPNVCPETAEQDKAVPFKVISKYRRVDPAQKYTPIFGVNAMSTDMSGKLEISVGDRVRVVTRNQWRSLPVSNGNKGRTSTVA